MIPLSQLVAGGPIDGVAHLIQAALTPVFLLTGVGNLLVLFNTRLARVSDYAVHVSDLLRSCGSADEHERLQRHILRLAHRVAILDASIALGAIGGSSTCGAALVLFLGSVSKAGVDRWLIGLFTIALGCTVASLIAFLGDSLLAWHGLRREGPLPKSNEKARGG
jgi:hypothetical protein